MAALMGHLTIKFNSIKFNSLGLLAKGLLRLLNQGYFYPLTTTIRL